MFANTVLISFGFLLSCASAVSVDLADWLYPTLAQIGDTVFIANGLPYTSSGAVSLQENGILYNLTLTEAFNSLNSNQQGEYVLQQMQVTSSVAPTFVGVSMISSAIELPRSHIELLSIGGLWYPTSTDCIEDVFLHLTFPTDQGFLSTKSPQSWLPERVAPVGNAPWNVAFGASVSAPSENLAFYFGGLTTPTGEFPSFVSNESNTANVLVDVLYRCNTSSLDAMQYSNITLPENINSRAEGNMVWIPVGTQGLLIVIGGMQEPADLSLAQVYNVTGDGNAFLSSLAVFDIASQEWFTVEATSPAGMPSIIASSCTIVAGASDRSSFQIYVYGGYNGPSNVTSNVTSFVQQALPQVWALSVPSFEWYLNSDAEANKRRMAHACVQPFPNIFIAVGGSIENELPLQTSLIDVFDLNQANWTGEYDPNPENYEYLVPTQIVVDIGGSQHGGATKTASMAPSLSSIFGQHYNGHIPTYYPYASTVDKVEALFSNKWLGTVFGITIYLLIATVAFILLILIRRRNLLQASKIDTSDIKSRNYVVRWMNNAEVKKKDTAVEEVELVKQDDIELSSLEGDARDETVGMYHDAGRDFDNTQTSYE